MISSIVKRQKPEVVNEKKIAIYSPLITAFHNDPKFIRSRITPYKLAPGYRTGSRCGLTRTTGTRRGISRLVNSCPHPESLMGFRETQRQTPGRRVVIEFRVESVAGHDARFYCLGPMVSSREFMGSNGSMVLA